MPIFLLFTLVPIAEIAIFAWVGGRIGVMGTIAMVLACAAAGAWLLRHQGLNTLRRAQEAAAQGRVPSKEMADGLVLLVAAVLLITPGFLSDAVGLLLLLPGVRHLVRRWVVARVVARAQGGAHGVHVHFGGGRDGAGPWRPGGGFPGGDPWSPGPDPRFRAPPARNQEVVDTPTREPDP